MTTQSHNSLSHVSLDLNLTPVQLNDLFAALDPVTGKWDLRNDRQRRNSPKGKATETIKQVYERLKVLEESVGSADYGYYLMSRSFTGLAEYQKNVVKEVRHEIGEHIRHVRAVGEKVSERLTDRWQWLIDIPLIGSLFTAVVMQIKGAFMRNLNSLLQSLKNREIALYRLEEKLETAKHLSKLFTESTTIKKAFLDYDQKKAEEMLSESRRQFPEDRRTFFLIRRDPQHLEGFILSKLDNRQEGAKVEHVPITARRATDTAYVYIRPLNPQNATAGMATLASFKALKRYLNDLQKSDE